MIVALFYLVALFADSIAYTDPFDTQATRSYIPPQPIHWFDADGRLPAPRLRAERQARPAHLQAVYAPDPSEPRDLVLFGHGYPYKLFGLIPTDIHLLGGQRRQAAEFAVPARHRPAGPRRVLAPDVRDADLADHRPGRRRAQPGARRPARRHLGLYGGSVDLVIQRVIEILRSIPTIPLWMGLAAAVPAVWTPQQVYFAITIIISLIGWTELARVVRGRFLALREEDFVTAAELAGASRMRIIFRHMVPSFLSHIIAAISLALPAMIISETSLSFLGLGLRPPAISWGVLLQDAQNLQTLGLAPWLLVVALPVIVVILAFNFLGDGLRDAADPYG